ncbi:ComF family protein [Dyadobacter sp. CY356]|uniref:ComF family protein n=1 Tax=Dyadobacter sp. CY356 TaxID=2906442 RepID=UPI001F2E34F7|nr:ComF family protein [Dyadobacter sp. CY356]MCF0059521.1 ComF family protein [Dyadobacter sp. CY356]
MASLWFDFVDLIFPRCCEACDKGLIGNEETICTSCRIGLPRIEQDSVFSASVKQKFVDVHEVAGTNSFLLFTKKGKVQKLLHALKYRGKSEIGVLLGFMFGQEMLSNGNLPEADLIVTVPLHKKKLKIRGYNQSDKLAEGFSNATNIPWSGKVLERTKFTETQTGKTRNERWENVKGVFQVNGNMEGLTVIIIDDILTTGATLEACMEVLKNAGCIQFHILTIASTQH